MSSTILYLGEDMPWSTSRHRALALSRLGHEVTHIGISKFAGPLGRVAAKLDFVTGHRFRQTSVAGRLREILQGEHWEIVWVDSGWWCGPKVADYLRSISDHLVLLCCDDPFGGRENHHWSSLKNALPKFSLAVTFREGTNKDFRVLGVPKIVQVRFGYDEVAHAPSRGAPDCPDLVSEVAFIGTRMENRHEFMIRLLQRGVPLSIWGNGWHNGPGWKQLQSVWRGPGIEGRQYVAAIQQAKVCLGMLSKLNRDQHTTRSAEVPYAGGLLCAQRTPEHQAMYEEDREAVFWADADECAEKCLALLADAPRREAIRVAGAAKVRSLNIGNESMVAAVLAALEQSPADRPTAPVVMGTH